ncbi:MAG: tetratricopeptide repeat protein [Planctomycetaceae bacterium]|nr:tetratricopeptide repeat protein [Planctomycetaceae bacterium]
MPEAVRNVAEKTQGLRPPRRIGRWIAVGVALVALVAGIPLGLSRYDSWREQRSKDFARHCRKLRQAKDWKTLAVVSDQWRSWETTSATAILFRAEAAQGVGEFQVAADMLNAIPAQSPKRLAALIERTTLLFGPLNQPLEGVRACHQVLELEPRAFAIHQRLIDYYAITLQQEELLRQIYRSIELGCEPIEAYVYLMLADVLTFQNGFEVTNRWLAADVSQETFLVARTIHMWKNLSLEVSPNDDTKQKLRLAEQLLRDYLDKYPQNLAVLTFFADLALKNGEVDQVESLLLRYPPTGTKDSRYWRFKGWLHAANDEPHEAEAAFRESLRIYPFSWTVRHELADILRRRRDFSQVAQMQELALRGKQLRQELMELPNARSVSKGVLIKIRDYASQCDDDFVTDSLSKRLRLLRD